MTRPPEDKEELVKTYFYIPENLWKRVEKFNQKVHLSSDAAAARMLIAVALRNEKEFVFTELPKKMTTKGIAFQAGLRENKPWITRHEVLNWLIRYYLMQIRP